jgi:murein DD-endopeptidase MepM/ murein hydrolase activator NlpD
LVIRSALALLVASHVGATAATPSPIEVVPGTVVRWEEEGTVACQRGQRRWEPLDGACLFPIDLIEPRQSFELVRWTSSSSSETLAVALAPYPYRVQRLEIPDDSMVHLSEADLARVLREEDELRPLWSREGERRFALPLAPPLAKMPAGGRFGAKRVINGEPRNPHSGADYTAPAGEPVRSVAPGQVAFAGEHFFAGRSVFVDHGDGLISMYFHLSRIDVAVGEAVRQGQRLGAVGSSGRATGPHLHFGVRWHGARVDPRALLDPTTIRRLPAE